MIRMLLLGIVNFVRRERPETPVSEEVFSVGDFFVLGSAISTAMGLGVVLPVSADIGALLLIVGGVTLFLMRWVPGSPLLDAGEWNKHGRPVAPWEDEWAMESETCQTTTTNAEGE